MMTEISNRAFFQTRSSFFTHTHHVYSLMLRLWYSPYRDNPRLQKIFGSARLFHWLHAPLRTNRRDYKCLYGISRSWDVKKRVNYDNRIDM